MRQRKPEESKTVKKLSTIAALVVAAIVVINDPASTPIETTDHKSADPSQVNADPVVASFERELARQPVQAAPVRRDAIANDVLYRTMNEIHWTPDGRSAADIAEEKSDELGLLDEIELESIE